jgi:hypothetical protein
LAVFELPDGEDAAKAVELYYSVSVQKADKPGVDIAKIKSSRITPFHVSKLPPDIGNEGRAGGLFEQVKWHRSVTIFATGAQFSADADIKNLKSEPHGKANLNVTIDLMRRATGVNGASPPQTIELSNRAVSRLQLFKVSLGDMRSVTSKVFAVDFDLSARDDKDPEKDTYTTYPKEYTSADDR